MAVYTFDGANRLIVLPSGAGTIQVADLYSRWVDWLLTGDNSKYVLAFRTLGGDPLSGTLGAGVYYFIQNQQQMGATGWRIRPAEEDAEIMFEGNLYPEDYNLPHLVPTLGAYTVHIVMERSSLTQVVSVSSGSGLSQDEHDKLMSIPDVTLTTEQAAKLEAIPDVTLTPTENSKLMGLPDAAGLTQEEHNQLMSVPLDAGGLTTDEHDKLMSMTAGGLTEDEHDALMSVPADTRAAVLGFVMRELNVGEFPAEPQVWQAVMALYMVLRNQARATTNKQEVFNDAGEVVAEATLSDDGTQFIRGGLTQP